VAYVSAVHADGSVDVEEYNVSPHAYGTRSHIRAPRYIHVLS
jgi:surface antigen